jgi:HEPN domain-containing protein
MSGAESPTPSDSSSARWLEKAADDLEVAELVLGSAVAARWAACFHAEQPAEKALKAVLVALGIDFPRTHSLERLADLLGSEADAFDRSVLIDLTPWAVAGRYPEDMPEPTQELATRLVAGAQSVVDAVRERRSGRADR